MRADGVPPGQACGDGAQQRPPNALQSAFQKRGAEVP